MQRLLESPPAERETLMALCRKQCWDCPMTVTVRIDFNEDPKKCDSAVSCMHRAVILDFYDEIAKNPANKFNDMALILHIDRADIAVVCTHFSNMQEANAVEFF
jgi:hypothetical protein